MRLVFGLGLLIGLSASSCEQEPGPAFQAEVCLQLNHHGVTPSDATIYLSATPDFPGYGGDMTTRFSRSEEMRPNGRVCFQNLGVGPHWFAAEGWDEVLADSVRGSKFLEITTRADFYDLEMEVSEQH